MQLINSILPFILGIAEFATTWNPFRSTHSASWIRKIFSDFDTISCWRWCSCLCKVSSLFITRNTGTYAISNDFDDFSVDKQFRKTLVETVPGIDPVLKVLLQEEGNALSEAKKSIDSATEKVIGAKDSVTSYFVSETKHEEPAPSKGMLSRPSGLYK